jgi:hypothetical protein
LNQIQNSIALDTVFAAELLGRTAVGAETNYQIYFSSSNYQAVSGIIPLNQNLEVNDPLVHYTLGDLTSPILSVSAPAVATNQILTPNVRYQPWPSQFNRSASTGNLTLQDPLIYSSDYWSFPDNSFPSIGMLGQVHRGTPWQTMFLKADPDEATGTGIQPNHNAWVTTWVNTLDTYPTNDYALLDLFTAAPNDNAARGLLSVNQFNDAPWYAVFSGLTTVNGGPITPTQIAQYQLVDSTNLGITVTRANEPNGIFHRAGNILKTPILSVASPFLPAAAQNCTDEEVERIPQQVMGLLKLGLPQFVVYGYGQSLKPKDIYFGAANFGICTNYQITSEFLTRTVLHVVGDPLAANARVVVDSYNILPGNN